MTNPDNIPTDVHDRNVPALPVEEAEDVARDPERAETLARMVLEKARRYRRILGDTWEYVQAFARMLRCYTRRQYATVPWKSIAMITAALIYFLTPLDFIPDFIFGGLFDDATVIAFVARQIRTDLDRFLAWERDQMKEAT